MRDQHFIPPWAAVSLFAGWIAAVAFIAVSATVG